MNNMDFIYQAFTVKIHFIHQTCYLKLKVKHFNRNGTTTMAAAVAATDATVVSMATIVATVISKAVAAKAVVPAAVVCASVFQDQEEEDSGLLWMPRHG